MKTRAIVFHEHGDPATVARVEEVELPRLSEGRVLVRVLYAPINPADLNFIEGTYAAKAKFPAIPGGEGLGEIVELGPGTEQWKPGDRVLFPAGIGTWRDQLVARAEELLPAPADVDEQQACMLRVNPPTAWRMLHDLVDLQPRDWIIQNVANSGVGRSVIQICAAKGWRTLNVVRRPELIDELKAIGADAVLVDEKDLPAHVAELTGHQPVRLALNAVGGESALRLAEVLAPGGTHVTYGAMAKQPLRIPNGMLIFKDLRFRGFWVTQWYRTADRSQQEAMLIEIFDLARQGKLHTPVDAVFPLEEVGAAIRRASEGARAGKVLLKPG